MGSTVSCLGARSLAEDALSSADESEKEGDGGEIGESATLGTLLSISPQRDVHVNDAFVGASNLGAVRAICC